MEGRKEKTQEINVTTQSSSSKSCSHADLIPSDLTREILLRLPSKSFTRFRCVSKLWSSITLDPNFINSRSSAQRSYLMLIFAKFDKQLFFFLPQQKKDLEMCLPHVEKYHTTFTKEKTYTSYTQGQGQSVHGLISFHYVHRIVIWNPSMGQYVTFQKPSKTGFTISYCGYDPIGNTYKLLSIPNDSTNEPHVLTLGAQESWRPIKYISLKRCLSARGICINGVLYFLATDGELREIMSFDVRTEKFKSIQTNSCMDMREDWKSNNVLVSYKGRLAWFTLESSLHKFWVLEDAKKEEWSYKNFHVPNSLKDPIVNVDYVLRGVTDDGVFIYVSVSWKDKEISVCYYDPLRNSNRKMMIFGFTLDVIMTIGDLLEVCRITSRNSCL